MTDFPSLPPLPLFVHTWTRWGVVNESAKTTTLAVAVINWPVANTAIYVPMWIPWPYPVRRVFWVNGSSVTSTNMDFGIYTDSGAKIYSTGSTACAGANASQYVAPTEFTLTPGRYYFALACSSTTASRGGQGSTSMILLRQRLTGMLSETSALPLPATMTPVALANACYPICGVTRTSSGF